MPRALEGMGDRLSEFRIRPTEYPRTGLLGRGLFTFPGLGIPFDTVQPLRRHLGIRSGVNFLDPATPDDGSDTTFIVVQCYISVERSVRPFFNMRIRPHCRLHDIENMYLAKGNRHVDPAFTILPRDCRSNGLQAQIHQYRMKCIQVQLLLNGCGHPQPGKQLSTRLPCLQNPLETGTILKPQSPEICIALLLTLSGFTPGYPRLECQQRLLVTHRHTCQFQPSTAMTLPAGIPVPQPAGHDEMLRIGVDAHVHRASFRARPVERPFKTDIGHTDYPGIRVDLPGSMQGHGNVSRTRKYLRTANSVILEPGKPGRKQIDLPRRKDGIHPPGQQGLLRRFRSCSGDGRSFVPEPHILPATARQPDTPTTPPVET